MNEPIPKKKMSSGAKWGIGCGIGCLTLIIIFCIGGWLAYRFIHGKVAVLTAELRQIGFAQEVKAQTLEVRNDIQQPVIYIGQAVKILGNCTTNLAIIAQMAEIHGKVEGKVYFRGQILTIQPKAELMNGLDVTAQVVQKYGHIQGDITGKYQTLEDKTVH